MSARMSGTPSPAYRRLSSVGLPRLLSRLVGRSKRHGIAYPSNVINSRACTCTVQARAAGQPKPIGSERYPEKWRPKRVAFTTPVLHQHELYTRPASLVSSITHELKQSGAVMLLGGPQTGKTTTAYAVQTYFEGKYWCRQAVPMVSLNVLHHQSSVDCVFRSILKVLNVRPDSSVRPAEQLKAHLSQNKQSVSSKATCKIALIFDDVDALESKADDEKDHFFKTLKELKQIGAVYVLVGTGQVAQMVKESAARKAAEDNTPIIHQDSFTKARVRTLIQELFEHRPAADLQMDLTVIADDIHEDTAGHKGFTGACLYYLDQLIQEGVPITDDAWSELRFKLASLIFLDDESAGKYWQIMTEVDQISKDPVGQKTLKHMVTTSGGVYVLQPDDLLAGAGQVPVYEWLIWLGIVKITDSNKLVMTSSLMLNALITSSIRAARPPAVNTFLDFRPLNMKYP